MHGCIISAKSIIARVHNINYYELLIIVKVAEEDALSMPE